MLLRFRLRCHMTFIAESPADSYDIDVYRRYATEGCYYATSGMSPLRYASRVSPMPSRLITATGHAAGRSFY